MSRELPRAEVRRIARLARLRLESPEVERLAVEMSEILRHFDALDATSAPAAATTPPHEAEAPAVGGEPDEPGSDPLTRDLAELAPDWREGWLVVPRLRALGGEPASDARPRADEDVQ